MEFISGTRLVRVGVHACVTGHNSFMERRSLLLEVLEGVPAVVVYGCWAPNLTPEEEVQSAPKASYSSLPPSLLTLRGSHANQSKSRTCCRLHLPLIGDDAALLSIAEFTSFALVRFKTEFAVSAEFTFLCDEG